MAPSFGAMSGRFASNAPNAFAGKTTDTSGELAPRIHTQAIPQHETLLAKLFIDRGRLHSL